MEDNACLKIGVNSDLIDLVPEYVRKRKNDFSRIPTLLKNKDFISIIRIGHQLRGNAAIFGLDLLEKKAAELELATRAAQEEIILRLCKEVMEFLERVEFYADPRD